MYSHVAIRAARESAQVERCHTMRQLDTIGQESVRLEREANLQLREWKNLRNTRNKVGSQ